MLCIWSCSSPYCCSFSRSSNWPESRIRLFSNALSIWDSFFSISGSGAFFRSAGVAQDVVDVCAKLVSASRSLTRVLALRGGIFSLSVFISCSAGCCKMLLASSFMRRNLFCWATFLMPFIIIQRPIVILLFACNGVPATGRSHHNYLDNRAF